MLAIFAMAPLVITPVGAQQLSDRAKQIGGKFTCMCGCSQVLTECNHVGCSTSAAMLKELNQSLSRGNSEDAITQMFVRNSERECTRSRRNQVSAWSLGSCRAFNLFVGAGVVIFVIARWRRRPAQQVPFPAGHRAFRRVAGTCQSAGVTRDSD